MAAETKEKPLPRIYFLVTNKNKSSYIYSYPRRNPEDSKTCRDASWNRIDRTSHGRAAVCQSEGDRLDSFAIRPANSFVSFNPLSFSPHLHRNCRREASPLGRTLVRGGDDTTSYYLIKTSSDAGPIFFSSCK